MLGLKKRNNQTAEGVKIGGNGHKLTLKQRLVRFLLKDAHIDELHIGAHSIVIDGDVIKMNALANDPATPAEGWIWYLAGATHKPRHRDNAGNKDIGEGAAPGAHKATHENGGGDEISVAGLSGELADNQPPKAHKASHQAGGGDELDLTGMKADSLAEKTADTGVTIDTCLIKDGKAADSLLLEGSNKAAVQTHAPASHDRTKHSDIDQSLLTSDNVAFAQVTVGDLVLKNGYRFTEHKKYGVCLKSPKGELYRLMVERC